MLVYFRLNGQLTMPEWYIVFYGDLWSMYGAHMGNLWGVYGESIGRLWGASGLPRYLYAAALAHASYEAAGSCVCGSGCARLQSHTYGDKLGIHIVTVAAVSDLCGWSMGLSVFGVELDVLYVWDSGARPMGI